MNSINQLRFEELHPAEHILMVLKYKDVTIIVGVCRVHVHKNPACISASTSSPIVSISLLLPALINAPFSSAEYSGRSTLPVMESMTTSMVNRKGYGYGTGHACGTLENPRLLCNIFLIICMTRVAWPGSDMVVIVLSCCICWETTEAFEAIAKYNFT